MPADTNHLLIIDPQNDFCDQNGAALPVAGACADLQRLADWLDQTADSLDQIHVTLDSHHPIDIAHPGWWQNPQAEAPPPFTVITADDLSHGHWQSRDPARQASSLAYLQALAAGGRYPLMIWPEHCLIGTWGHAIYPPLADALQRWARRQQRQVHYVWKGLSPQTEHYSAIAAEVVDAADAHTQANTELLTRLAAAGQIWVAGQALSHCVAATIRDIVAHLGVDRASQPANKITLLTDCTSAVSGFEDHAAAFITEQTRNGMRTTTSGALRAATAR